MAADVSKHLRTRMHMAMRGVFVANVAKRAALSPIAAAIIVAFDCLPLSTSAKGDLAADGQKASAGFCAGWRPIWRWDR